MPTAYTGFILKPLGFFDHNPALDVPPQSRLSGHVCGAKEDEGMG
jgi:primary-amine oxidase